MFQIHHMTLNDPWYEYVKDGLKTYEGRCNKKQYIVGDQIVFTHHTDITQLSFIKTIVEVLHFKSFDEALTKLCLHQILPNVSTITDGVVIYKKYVSQETQDKYGVVMIKLN